MKVLKVFPNLHALVIFFFYHRKGRPMRWFWVTCTGFSVWFGRFTLRLFALIHDDAPFIAYIIFKHTQLFCWLVDCSTSFLIVWGLDSLIDWCRTIRMHIEWPFWHIKFAQFSMVRPIIFICYQLRIGQIYPFLLGRRLIKQTLTWTILTRNVCPDQFWSWT
jgi:hypothetical protein